MVMVDHQFHFDQLETYPWVSEQQLELLGEQPFDHALANFKS